MNNKNHFISINFLLLLLFLFLSSPAGRADENEGIHIKWALIIRDHEKKCDVTTNMSEIESSYKLSYKIIFQPVMNAFIYLYRYSSKKDLILLFPQDFTFFNSGYKMKEWYTSPPGDIDWIHLDGSEKGLEKFFLLVSDERLTAIESLTRELKKNPEDQAMQKIQAMQKTLYEEILRKIKNNYTQDEISVPVPIAGLVKGEEATVYEVKDVFFYAKIITIISGNTD